MGAKRPKRPNKENRCTCRWLQR